MFRKHKFTIIAFMIGLIFLSMNTMLIDAQIDPDDFPIGMYIEYNIRFDAATGPDYEYTILYEFTQWIDQESFIVEYKRGDYWLNEVFPDIRLGGIDFPRLWMDVSTWQLHDYLIISGNLYEFVSKLYVWIPPLGVQECFLLETETVNDDIRSTSSLVYHGQLGIFLHSVHVDENLEESSWVESYNRTIVGSNLDEFNPPTFTQTTTTTTPTSTSTTSTSETTSQTSGTEQPSMNSTVVALSVGIVIECIIIVLIFMRKQSSNS